MLKCSQQSLWPKPGAVVSTPIMSRKACCSDRDAVNRFRNWSRVPRFMALAGSGSKLPFLLADTHFLVTGLVLSRGRKAGQSAGCSCSWVSTVALVASNSAMEPPSLAMDCWTWCCSNAGEAWVSCACQFPAFLCSSEGQCSLLCRCVPGGVAPAHFPKDSLGGTVRCPSAGLPSLCCAFCGVMQRGHCLLTWRHLVAAFFTCRFGSLQASQKWSQGWLLCGRIAQRSVSVTLEGLQEGQGVPEHGWWVLLGYNTKDPSKRKFTKT
jgi:hypothetical protein